MPRMLNHLGLFVRGLHLCLAGAESGTRLAYIFQYYSPPKLEYDKSPHQAVLEHIQVYYLFF